MAPVGVLFSSPNSLYEVNIPMLLLRAEKDDELAEPYHSEIIAKNFDDKNKLTYRTIENAGHYSFITPFPEVMKNQFGIVADDPEGFDRTVFHKKLSSCPQITSRYRAAISFVVKAQQGACSRSTQPLLQHRIHTIGQVRWGSYL